MRVLIVSDTHEKHRNLYEVLDREGEIDMMLHLGDVGDGQYDIEALAEFPVHLIAGNNDYFSYLPREKEIKIGKYRIFMVHGHEYSVYRDTSRLRQAARARGVDIVMYGHTHVPYMDLDDDVIVLNPGSISLPRQEGCEPSYIMMEIDRNGNADFELKYL